MSDPLNICIVGSTGSVGRSTLEVVRRYRGRLRVVGLTAGTNVEKLIEQALAFRPEIVAIRDEAGCRRLRDALAHTDIVVLSGDEGVCSVAAHVSARTTVISVVGFAGVRPTLAAITAGKTVALANKESVVAAGPVVMPLAQEHRVPIIPIDSEHSAIHQCLRVGRTDEVARIILTASGGPFRQRPAGAFDTITPQEALAHPTWRMGPRITIDSATLMNKGFEIIEAAWLFGIDPDRIDVVIHPQSIVHSLVEFHDGSTMAQLGAPDMTVPIAYALFYPERPEPTARPPIFDPLTTARLDFEQPDAERFPALALARRAHAMGGTGGAVLNAADEVAVGAFLNGTVRFPQITEFVSDALDAHRVPGTIDIDALENADRWARQYVTSRIEQPKPRASRETRITELR